MNGKGLTFIAFALLTGILSGACGAASAASGPDTGAINSLSSYPGSETYSGKTAKTNGPDEVAVARDLSENSTASGAAPQVKFTIPKSASLAYFTFNLTQAFETGKNDDSYKKMVSAAKYEANTTTTALAPVNFLKEKGFAGSLDLCGISAAQNPIRNALDLLFFAGLYSADLEDLKANAKPIFAAITADGGDPELDTKVYGVLETWSAEHEKLFTPTSNVKTQVIGAFQGRAAALKISPVIAKINVFTGGKWPVGVPFTVGLTPIPPKSVSGVGGRTYATAIHIPLNLHKLGEDWHGYLDPKIGIVVHETFHSMLGLYLNAGPNPVTGSLKGKNKKKNTQINDLSEVLATAVGQGYIVSKGNKSALWHGFTGVDGAAKEIYPLFMDYLYFGKPIDENFMKAFLKIRAKYRKGSYTW